MTTATLAAIPVDDSQTSRPRSHGWSGTEREGLIDRLGALAALLPDWDGYGARVVDWAALRQAQVLIDWSLTSLLPVPRIVPVPTGGVQLEWTAGPVELELEVEPGGRSFVFVCDDDYSGQRIDGELPRDVHLLRLAVSRIAAHA